MAIGLDDRKNVVGLSSLMKDDDMGSGMDFAELEREIANGVSDESLAELNVADEYKREMNQLSRNLDIDVAPIESFNNAEDPVGEYFDTTMEQSLDAPIEQPFSRNSYNSPRNQPSFNADQHNSNAYSNDSDWNTHSIQDTHLKHMTQEEKKQDQIQNVFNDIDDRELAFTIEKERDEDDKASLLEQIDMLKITLEDDGVDISGIPSLDKNSSMSEVHNVYKILRLKNDRNRYCSFAEELILSGAHGMEYLFDGKKEWFGRQPDLTGWSSTVKVKLRRLRYETSSLVKEVMQEYNMSSGIRLALELFPSMFLYSRNRRLTQNDNLVSDADYKNAISDLNDI